MKTLIIIKPDAVQRGLIGEIIGRFEKIGKILGLKLLLMDKKRAQRLYSVHEGKPFYDELVDYITSGPVVVGVLDGENIIKIAREILGATNPENAVAGTIRGDFGLDVGKNTVHGSDSVKSAEYEIPIFFSENELVDR